MNKSKIVSFVLTICLGILLPVLVVGLNPQYTYAQDTELISGTNISEILLDTDIQEMQNVYGLKLVTVVINGKPISVLTHRTDVYRLLRDVGVVVDNSKRIIATDENLGNGSVVRVITVGTVVEELNIDIPFSTETINTKEIPYGDEEVTQIGVLGVRTQQIRKVYEDGKLIEEEVLSDEITRDPTTQIVLIGVLSLGIEDLEQTYGYNCDHWYSVVDSGNYTDQEKQWLKFVMECESGCNAENDKNSTYKGLFQWNPYYWNKLYGEDNIYDGYAQIKNTIDKIRKGAKMDVYWPACHRAYVREYGEFVR